jgi:hypothetical protein
LGKATGSSWVIRAMQTDQRLRLTWSALLHASYLIAKSLQVQIGHSFIE